MLHIATKLTSFKAFDNDRTGTATTIANGRAADSGVVALQNATAKQRKRNSTLKIVISDTTHACLGVYSSHSLVQSAHQASPRHADWMAECDCTAVHIDPGRIQIHQLQAMQR